MFFIFYSFLSVYRIHEHIIIVYQNIDFPVKVYAGFFYTYAYIVKGRALTSKFHI